MQETRVAEREAEERKDDGGEERLAPWTLPGTETRADDAKHVDIPLPHSQLW